MLAAFVERRLKACAQVEAFGGRQTQHGFGQIGIELIKDRFAQGCGDVAGDAVDNPPD
ncbi:hypothetical protein SDC9_211722 [bioreactor metagenome]|uniref:Uncharacterized protein n=1 Tax=bioreactor metagenome TaxID=1076179 RepID=A0A645JXV4_9ZZZZ